MSKTYTLNRCRPVPEGEWSNTKTYLELSVVYDASNGNSYTSKKVVPAGTLLTNTEYWVKTSDFNSQLIEKGNYYNNVAAMKADSSLVAGMTAITKGYTTQGDAKSAIYEIVTGVHVNSETYEQIDFVKRNILSLYQEDLTKYDDENNSRKVISDREKAFEQLSVSDYLI